MKKLSVVSGLILLALLFTVSGCDKYQKVAENQKLEGRLAQYEKISRWGSLAHLYSFLSADLAAETPVPDNLGTVKITSYEVRVPPRRDGQGRAIQVAEIQYLFKEQQVMKTLNDSQLWEINAEDNKWYRVNPIPEFK